MHKSVFNFFLFKIIFVVFEAHFYFSFWKKDPSSFFRINYPLSQAAFLRFIILIKPIVSRSRYGPTVVCSKIESYFFRGFSKTVREPSEDFQRVFY